jgi:potassium-dependent mechanosensitive channel
MTPAPTDGQAMAAPMMSVLVSVALIAAAALLHWLVERLSRRLPVTLTRLFSRRDAKSPAVVRSWERPVQILLLPVKLALWIGTAYLVTERFAVLRGARAISFFILTIGLEAPLFVLNGREYTSVDLLELPAVLFLLWIVVRALGKLLTSQLLRSVGVERGVEDAVGVVFRYTLMFLGVIIVLQVWGINASSLTVFAGVLGVGIGFGLQNLANNFVSGLVLNLERPIRVGDFLSVGELVGTVEKIGTRCTEIRTLDQVAILVPNSRLLENEVINWTHGDPLCRLHLPVGVAYGSDVRRVRSALLEAARGHPDLLQDPRPRVEFRGFGDSSLDFELLVWTNEPRNQNRIKSDLNFRIEASLRRHAIQIPFPQRDLHLRSPQVDQILRAWSRRQFSTEELAAALAPDEAGDGQRDGQELLVEDDLGPRGWSEERIAAFIERMRAAGGVAIGDRRHLLNVYPKCFVGHEAVEWMTKVEGLTHDEAVSLGSLLVERGLIHHVLDEHGFEDGNLFYRFVADEHDG